MLGMGWPEVAVVIIVCIFVFGPDRLPDLARQAGRFVRTIRRMADNARSDLAREMGDDFKDLQNLNLRDLDPREIVRRNVVEAMGDDDKPRPTPSRRRPGHDPLPAGSSPPFDDEAT